MKVVEKDKKVLAVSMNRAVLWSLEENRLILKFNTAFDSSLVREEGPYIQKVLKEKTGQEFRLDTKLENMEAQKKEEKDLQIEMICSVFRATLV